MANSSPRLILSIRMRRVLHKHIAKRSTSQKDHLRISAVLGAADGKSSIQIALDINSKAQTIRRWRNRWHQHSQHLEDFEKGHSGNTVSDKELLAEALSVLDDSPRSGKPVVILEHQKEQLTAIACQKPSDHGLPHTNWTHNLLAEQMVKLAIVPSISPGYCGAVLRQKKLQPHKNEYWLHPHIDNWEEFKKQVQLISFVIMFAISRSSSRIHVLSIDEKSGIQALQRISSIAPNSKKRVLRSDPEYKRHGTTSLMAATDVGTGKIVHYRLLPTRNEEDFTIFITQILDGIPKDDNVIILADQLNIHYSASLVRLIAERNGFKGELGEKRKKGILFNKASRKSFLTCDTNKVRFVFTPKHCSWLNPIENWFSILQRHVITRGNFCSVKDLESKIQNYISYYNDALAKPMNWKFKGFWKTHVLQNSKRA